MKRAEYVLAVITAYFCGLATYGFALEKSYWRLGAVLFALILVGVAFFPYGLRDTA